MICLPQRLYTFVDCVSFLIQYCFLSGSSKTTNNSWGYRQPHLWRSSLCHAGQTFQTLKKIWPSHWYSGLSHSWVPLAARLSSFLFLISGKFTSLYQQISSGQDSHDWRSQLFLRSISVHSIKELHVMLVTRAPQRSSGWYGFFQAYEFSYAVFLQISWQISKAYTEIALLFSTRILW